MEIKVKKLSYKELEQGYKNALNRLSKCEKKLDKIKEYIKRKDLVNTNEITNGNIKYILELLEEIE